MMVQAVVLCLPTNTIHNAVMHGFRYYHCHLLNALGSLRHAEDKTCSHHGMSCFCVPCQQISPQQASKCLLHFISPVQDKKQLLWRRNWDAFMLVLFYSPCWMITYSMYSENTLSYAYKSELQLFYRPSQFFTLSAMPHSLLLVN